MAIRTSGYYNDPAFAQAASNLSALFAPPSGADAAGWATADARRAEAQRLAELFDYAKGSTVDQARFDRMGVAAGNYAPMQSYYAVNTDASTRMRGQDIDAQTSRLNNANTVRGGVIGQLYGALNPGQIRPDVPADIAGAVGLPAVPSAAGAPKPLTDAELKASILAGLPQGEQRAAALGNTPVENVVGPDGKPVIAWQADSIGQQPYVNAGAQAKPTNAVALLPDGRTQVPAVQDPTTGRWMHAQTGQPLPPDIRVFDLPKATGSASDIGMGATTANQTSGNSLDATIVATENLLNQYETVLRNNPGVIGLPGAVRGMAQDAISTVSELSAAFGDTAPDARVTLDQVKNLAERISPTRDPNIQVARSLAMSLAYQDAQLQNPSGEVSRQAFERSYEKLTGGMLRNNQSALESVQGMRMLIDAKRQQVDALRQPGSVPPAPPAPPGPPAPPAPPGPPTGAPTRLRFDANGNPM